MSRLRRARPDPQPAFGHPLAAGGARVEMVVVIPDRGDAGFFFGTAKRTEEMWSRP